MSNPDFYRAKRQEYLDGCVAYLRLVEISGKSEMGVVLNFDAITLFQPRERSSRTERPNG